MANSDAALSELSNLIARLNQEKANVSQRLTEIETQVRAVEITMRLIRHNGKHAEPDSYDALVAKLKKDKNKGKITQMDALVTIATAIGDNGAFKVQDAKRVMLNAELISNPKNADSVIYALIDRSDKFEKVVPGEYKLIGGFSEKGLELEWRCSNCSQTRAPTAKQYKAFLFHARGHKVYLANKWTGQKLAANLTEARKKGYISDKDKKVVKG